MVDGLDGEVLREMEYSSTLLCWVVMGYTVLGCIDAFGNHFVQVSQE